MTLTTYDPIIYLLKQTREYKNMKARYNSMNDTVAKEIIGQDSSEVHALYVNVGDKAISDGLAKLPIIQA